jgi:hypothetical protein
MAPQLGDHGNELFGDNTAPALASAMTHMCARRLMAVWRVRRRGSSARCCHRLASHPQCARLRGAGGIETRLGHELAHAMPGWGSSQIRVPLGSCT